MLSDPRSRFVRFSTAVRGDDLALADDDDLLADLLHFRQDVRAENDRVVARQALDQRPGLDDLLRVQAGGGLVQNQDVGIVDDRLRQSDALPVAFGKLADQLVADIGDGASLASLRLPGGRVRFLECL